MDKVFFGVDYYPEHWPEDRWETDCDLMREMGVQFVRMAEFSWARMEPEEGKFNFDWLEKIIRMLGERGIRTVLGTPSAAPPAWIINKNREILPVNSRGMQVEFGGRHHDCQSNQVYRGHIRRFVTAMTKRFGENPNVIGWQVDNELGNSHYDFCFCESCAKSFRKWLEKKYGAIENLNRATGGAFWSQEYSSFDQIQPPRVTSSGHNPSIVLDWKRFHSDLIVDFHRMQARIIRENSPGRFITHNCMGFSDIVSYYDLGEDLDFMSHDQYPAGHFAKQPVQDTEDLAASLDVMRSFRKKPFWIMEQQSYMTGWETMGRLPKPGQAAMWSMQSIAHGADAICWFRWRSCAFGTEQYWHGVLPHSGIPGRTYEELKNFIRDTKPLLEEMNGAMPKVRAAIVFSYEQGYAFQIQPHHRELRYLEHLMTYYRALFRNQIPVDFVNEKDDLSGYQLVVAPLQYLMTPELEKHYGDYVARGGRLILTMRTGVKNAENVCMTDGPLPGRLGKVLGLTVPEYDCLTDIDGTVVYRGREYTVRKWADLPALDGAEALAEYSFEFYAGTPAITKHAYGEGYAYYVGTEMSEELASALLGDICGEAGVESLGSASEGVELCARDKDGRRYSFVINHTGREAWAEVKGFERIELKPYEYRVLKGDEGF